MTFTFDRGMLIALERRKPRATEALRAIIRRGLLPVVPAVVVAEWWRGRSDVREEILAMRSRGRVTVRARRAHRHRSAGHGDDHRLDGRRRRGRRRNRVDDGDGGRRRDGRHRAAEVNGGLRLDARERRREEEGRRDDVPAKAPFAALGDERARLAAVAKEGLRGSWLPSWGHEASTETDGVPYTGRREVEMRAGSF